MNLVSHEHVDLPFHNDREVGVVEHVFSDDVARRSRSSAPSSTRPRSTPAAWPFRDRVFVFGPTGYHPGTDIAR